jgi:hypothetical protein
MAAERAVRLRLCEFLVDGTVVFRVCSQLSTEMAGVLFCPISMVYLYFFDSSIGTRYVRA